MMLLLLSLQWPSYAVFKLTFFIVLQIMCCNCACISDDEADHLDRETARKVCEVHADDQEGVDTLANYMISPHFENYMLLHNGVSFDTSFELMR